MPKKPEVSAAAAQFNASSRPAWVRGGVTGDGSSRKYDRAVKTLKDANVLAAAQGREQTPITEEAVKALYIKYGGAIAEEDAE